MNRQVYMKLTGDIDTIAPTNPEQLAEAAVLELLRSELGAEVIGTTYHVTDS